MIEDIEKLRSELDRGPLGHPRNLVQGYICLVESGAVEEFPAGVSDRP